MCNWFDRLLMSDKGYKIFAGVLIVSEFIFVLIYILKQFITKYW